MRALGELLTPARLMQMLTTLQATSAGLRESTNPRTDAELCLIHLCDETLDSSLVGLTARLERLEQRMEYGIPAAPAAPAPAAKPAPAQSPKQSEPEDLPPWDLDPPAPVPKKEVPVTPPPAPAPKAVPAGSSAAFWKSLVAALDGKVPMGEYSFLSEPSSVIGEYADGVLTLWADSDFVMNMINKPSVIPTVTSEAGRMVGKNVQVFVKVGRPAPAPAVPQAPAPTQAAHDNLEDLLALGQQFDNIDIKL